MLILPAIDLRRGRVVRSAEGPGASDVVYADDPVTRARAFLAEGARWLHVVDLDRAFTTGRHNDDVVCQLAALPDASIQMGGLLVSADQVVAAFDRGATRVVVATAAAANDAELRGIAARVGGERLVVAIDVRAGRPDGRGAAIASGETPATIAKRAIDLGVPYLIYRDLARDGSLTGAELTGAEPLLGLGARILVAGGVESMAGLRRAAAMGMDGAIVGRALHERRFTLAEAQACFG